MHSSPVPTTSSRSLSDTDSVESEEHDKKKAQSISKLYIWVKKNLEWEDPGVTEV